MSLVAQYDLAHDATFQKRVAVLAVEQAVAVLTEGPGVPNHAGRLGVAQTVLSDPERMVPRLALALVAAAPSLTADTTDTDLRAAMAQVFALYVG